ncbi:hypothetical protein EAE32_01510 [Kocuria tytonicola]|uniref:Uncharacterized protein n=1 Tax=Kocuria tytonicola TaxID=2055946 RepID=A0A3L9L4L3_9MICC|nr:hypothetical protein [Kocuria tytonicola]RLY93946.1 hypothetical protein EAE32_01510 [Kocuria tytonicola]
MQFNFRRAKTPAYLTSLALVVIGLLFAVGSMSVLAWIVTILGIVLNVMAVSITQITGSPARARGTGTRVVTEPEAETDQHEVVPPAAVARGGSAALRAPARGAAEGARKERENSAS